MRRPGRLLSDAGGATAIEYGLICGLIIVALLGGLALLGDGAVGLIGSVATRVNQVG
ncbi:Flp family type IVb pilin [Sphingomonas morindae]|uniref:Flp family type IVb pilin n=1 Tax=Sphingomonas morindae TaxID=1541170 RepID=A0ABY4X5R4_9SPHN|nr:Flp family type IVb pilin [Sphingomonas morindae]USI72200.1 Flp family type IVb pilin [Sphingomonas morindae]